MDQNQGWKKYIGIPVEYFWRGLIQCTSILIARFSALLCLSSPMQRCGVRPKTSRPRHCAVHLLDIALLLLKVLQPRTILNAATGRLRPSAWRRMRLNERSLQFVSCAHQRYADPPPYLGAC